MAVRGRGIPRAVGLLVLYLIISVLRQILEPKIVGKYIGLYPLATLFSMYVGLKLMGVLGLLLFPLGVMVGKGVLDRRSAEKTDIRPKRRNTVDFPAAVW